MRKQAKVNQLWKTLPRRNIPVFHRLNVSHHHLDPIPPNLRCLGNCSIYSQKTRLKILPMEARVTPVAIYARKYRSFATWFFKELWLVFRPVLLFFFNSKVVKISGGLTSPLKVNLEIHHKSYLEALDYQPKSTPPSTSMAQNISSISTCRTRSLKPEKQRAMDHIHRSIALRAIQTDQS
jgi:hypothetical protein